MSTGETTLEYQCKQFILCVFVQIRSGEITGMDTPSEKRLRLNTLQLLSCKTSWSRKVGSHGWNIDKFSYRPLLKVIGHGHEHNVFGNVREN